MTHEEYLSGFTELTDADAGATLAHAESCASCRQDERQVDRALSRLEPRRHSWPEEIVRWAAVAAVLTVVAFGLRQEPAPAPRPAATARYRIVGDASGVVAYTPGGIVVGTAVPAISKEVLR